MRGSTRFDRAFFFFSCAMTFKGLKRLEIYVSDFRSRIDDDLYELV